jgi:hypothetical protein
MGQITVPSAPGITVLPTDRQTGPNAGGGNSGNDTLFIGGNAGLNNAGANSIGLGNSALSSGNTIPGVITIGAGAGASLTGQRFSGNTDLVIGTNANHAAQLSGDMVVIGNFALQNAASSGGGLQGYTSVLIGNYAAQWFGLNYPGAGGIINSVAIGDHVIGSNSASAGGSATVNEAVIIGTNAVANITLGVNGSISTSVVIGYNALPGVQSKTVATSVFIGDNTTLTITGAQDVVSIGSANPSQGSSPQFCVAVGANAWNGVSTTCIGYNAGSQNGSGNGPGSGSIYIGANSGQAGADGASYVFNVEVQAGGNLYTMFYGNMNSGNLAVGNLPFANRDLKTIGCTNALKLTNGTRGTGNPSGGGFFYVSAGALHWVGTSGTDTTIAPA